MCACVALFEERKLSLSEKVTEGRIKNWKTSIIIIVIVSIFIIIVAILVLKYHVVKG